MRRIPLTAFLLLLLSGLTTASVAQPLSGSEASTTGISSTPDIESRQDSDHSVALRSKRQKRSLAPRKSVQEPLLENVTSNPLPLNSASTSAPSPVDVDAQSDSGNSGRKIAYIVGGVLVAGGAVLGILALSGGEEGIPPPGDRP